MGGSLCPIIDTRDELKRSRHAELTHRISVRYHLPSLTREQTAASIDFQMQTAAACLLQAQAMKLDKISAALVNETASEFQLP